MPPRPAPLDAPAVETPKGPALVKAASRTEVAAPAPAPAPPPQPEPAKADAAVTPAALEPVEAPTPGADRGWAEVRRKMKELGVARYWVEGEAAGPARFRCTVPLPGQRSVAQQFEAEGDDVVAAAEAALRRVVLWKATESP